MMKAARRAAAVERSRERRKRLDLTIEQMRWHLWERDHGLAGRASIGDRNPAMERLRREAAKRAADIAATSVRLNPPRVDSSWSFTPPRTS
jgi:hypothetical protein